MRAVILIVPLFFLAAYKDEPDFDARYDKAAKEIEARARAMDADIAESEAAANAADEPERAIEPGGKIPRVSPEPLPDSARPSNAPSSSGE